MVLIVSIVILKRRLNNMYQTIMAQELEILVRKDQVKVIDVREKK